MGDLPTYRRRMEAIATEFGVGVLDWTAGVDVVPGGGVDIRRVAAVPEPSLRTDGEVLMFDPGRGIVRGVTGS